MGLTLWWPPNRLRVALLRIEQLTRELREERRKVREVVGRATALRGALEMERAAVQAYRDKADGERAASERYASELAQIRAAMDRVITFEGMVDQSPLPMLIDGLVRDNSELEARIEAVLLLCEQLPAEDSSSSSDISCTLDVDRLVALLRGAPRVPDTPEGL